VAEDATKVDVTRKFVRLVERRADGLVEFEFSIGLPELYVEMLLPAEAYEAFCRNNAVEFLEGPRPLEDTGADWEWRLRDASSERFRSRD
jgi:phenol hydroxylase P0 protein